MTENRYTDDIKCYNCKHLQRYDDGYSVDSKCEKRNEWLLEDDMDKAITCTYFEGDDSL